MELLSTFADNIKTVSEVLTAIAAAFAIWGLNAWKRQMKSQASYEVARRLLRAAYRVRDALNSVRNPLVTNIEQRNAEKAVESEPDIYMDALQDKPAASKRAMYKLRWEALNKPLSDLELEVLEAEVLWGSKIRQSVVPLNKSIMELVATIDQYLNQFEVDGEKLEGDAKQKVRATLYRHAVRPEENEYEKKLSAAVGEIEKLVRPFLKLR
jgi:hypothetical protein